MPSWLVLVRELLDLRGRCNRRGLMAMAGVILALEAALVLVLALTAGDFDGLPASLVKGALLYVVSAGAAKRLHDLGRSAWSLVGGVLGLVLWIFMLTLAVMVMLGPEAARAGGPAFVAIVIATLMPALALFAWLHLAKGEAVDNRYGPVPESRGFSRPQSGLQPAQPSTAVEA